LLIPGLSPEFAIGFVNQLREKISKLKYRGITEPVTVSVGMCFADPDCYLTNRELQQMANLAKERAKGTKEEREKAIGKNRVAAYVGNGFGESDLRIVAPGGC